MMPFMALQTLTTIVSFLLLTSGALSSPVLANSEDSPRNQTRTFPASATPPSPHFSPGSMSFPDLSGTWEIQEEDKTYHATLDAQGNGPYTHQGGTFTTTKLEGHLWLGKWSQQGNDREGEFEVLLSEDFLTAEGEWWYTRVGEHPAIPPRLYGGSYFFRKLEEKPSIRAP